MGCCMPDVSKGQRTQIEMGDLSPPLEAVFGAWTPKSGRSRYN